MSVNDQYALNWSNHPNHIKKAFDSLLAGNEFVDVTLSCEGKKITAHKILLSACSTYFHDLFRDNPCQHPIVILKDVKYQNLVDILKFMYNGEVSVSTENFESFLKTAELLQVSGLTDDENRIGGELSTKEIKGVVHKVPETSKKHSARSPTHNLKSIEQPKKRVLESTRNDEEIVEKKKKENEGRQDIEIKQEAIEFNLIGDENEEEDDDMDPLQFDLESKHLEEIDMSQAAGSQKYDIQDVQGDNHYKSLPPCGPWELDDNAIQGNHHIPTNIPRTVKKQYPTRNCRQCPGRKETRFQCIPCGNIPLHPKACFFEFHRNLANFQHDPQVPSVLNSFSIGDIQIVMK